MGDIKVIIPIINGQGAAKELQAAYNSVERCAENYKDGKVSVIIVGPKDELYPLHKAEKPNGSVAVEYVYNTGPTDFCSQVNLGVEAAGTEFFSILEFDDYYMPKWFRMFAEYEECNKDVSMFLPINVAKNEETGEMSFVNDIVWASSFSDEIGYIDHACLENCSMFNLTGGVFRTSEWLKLKPSMKVSFNYEYLLRATNKGQKVFVVPKEGYHHTFFRPESLSSEYKAGMSEKETEEWFRLAQKECMFDEDRGKTPITEKTDGLK